MHPTRACPALVFSFLSSGVQRLWLMCYLKCGIVTPIFGIQTLTRVRRADPKGIFAIKRFL